MSTEVVIHSIRWLTAGDLQSLLDESRSEGFGFLDRLMDEFASGTNRFNGPG